MEPTWDRIRRIATLTVSGIVLVALALLYALAGNLTRTALAWMFLLALTIPVGVWALLTLIGWQAGPGVRRPHALIAWANDRHRHPLLVAGFVAWVFLGSFQIAVEIQRAGAEGAMRQAFDKAVHQDLRDACYPRARQLLDTRATADVDLRDRVPHFCSCLNDEVAHGYTPAEFAAAPKELWWTAGDQKFDRLVQKCRINDSSLVRATRAIRAAGGKPDSEEMQAKILAYAACVKGDLEHGFKGVVEMKTSSELAWQDGNDKFRQIIARCTKEAGW